MKISTRSVLMAGATMLAASTVAIAQSVQLAPPPTPAPTVHLVAAVQPLVQRQQPPLLTMALDSPPAPAPLAVPIAPNLANTIDNVYLAVEPWVQYGFEVATAVVRWIPYVGWFAGQIMVVYEFGESIVASGVFNFTDWLRGDGGIVENLVDFGVDVGLAFVWLGLDEVAQFVPLPPFCCYPPRPPVQGPFLAVESLVGPAETAEPMMAASVEGSGADDVEQLGENPGEEQEPGEDVIVEEPDSEEAAETDNDLAKGDTRETMTDLPGTVEVQGDIDPSSGEDADGFAPQGVDATDGDAVDSEAEPNAVSTDDAAPTTADEGPDTDGADSADGDGGEQ